MLRRSAIGRPRLLLGLDLEALRERGSPVDLVADVEGVVLAVRAHAPGAEEPAPEAEAALLAQLAVEHEPPVDELVVDAFLLMHAVDVDVERRTHARRQGNDRS